MNFKFYSAQKIEIVVFFFYIKKLYNAFTEYLKKESSNKYFYYWNYTK